MFTGIVEELGVVKSLSRRGNITKLEIAAKAVCSGAKIGDSIAVNGACLTLVKNEGGILGFEILSETSQRTNLGKLKISDKVNLERSLKAGGRISGHFVTGHIDCIGVIRNKGYINSNFGLGVAIPQEYSKYIVPKGSVSIDGISLTVVDVRSAIFSVYIIPHTLNNTTLSFKTISSPVNIEFDILAKYCNK